jgi:hypothetical protein
MLTWKSHFHLKVRGSVKARVSRRELTSLTCLTTRILANRMQTLGLQGRALSQAQTQAETYS